MKTIGLIGGMSCESSAHYYHLINQMVRERLGGFHSALSLMYSLDFADIEQMQRTGDWMRATELMIDVAQRLQAGGADCVLLCSNTMNKTAEDVEAAIDIPLIHIVDVTAKAIMSKGLKSVGLLGTMFTMEQDFWRGRLARGFDIELLVPDKPDREVVHRIIYDELCLGIVKTDSRQRYLDVINRLVTKGSQGIILGCTEIPLLVKPEDTDVPLFDTTAIHATAAVDFALT